MRKFLQKFVDWIAMLLRWLCIAPNDAVQCQHDTRMEKHRDIDAGQERRGLISSELVKTQRLFAECKSFIRQRFKRIAALCAIILATGGVAIAQERENLDFHDGLNGWKVYTGAVHFLYPDNTYVGDCSDSDGCKYIYGTNQKPGGQLSYVWTEPSGWGNDGYGYFGSKIQIGRAHV